MGCSRKEEIAKLKRERRNSKAAKKRKESIRERNVRFLIVCEGVKTEPFYFKALEKNCLSSIREVTIQGEGKATVALVERTREIKKVLERNNAMAFDRVWVVFDKDDFDDFNEAINRAKQYGFKAAWTNEAFELWYYLHFEYLDSGISRDAYIEKLGEAFRKRMDNSDFRYEKGNPEIYNLLQQYGREDLAKRYAKKLRGLFSDRDYAKHKPCTMVDILVNELQHPETVREK